MSGSYSRRDQRALMYAHASSDADKQREERVLALLAEKKRRREQDADKSAKQTEGGRSEGTISRHGDSSRSVNPDDRKESRIRHRASTDDYSSDDLDQSREKRRRHEKKKKKKHKSKRDRREKKDKH